MRESKSVKTFQSNYLCEKWHEKVVCVCISTWKNRSSKAMNNSSNTTAVYMILKITIMALLDSLNMFFFCVAQQLTPHTLNIILRIDEMASFINKNKISIWGGGGGREDKNCHVKQIFRKLKLTKILLKSSHQLKE